MTISSFRLTDAEIAALGDLHDEDTQHVVDDPNSNTEGGIEEGIRSLFVRGLIRVEDGELLVSSRLNVRVPTVLNPEVIISCVRTDQDGESAGIILVGHDRVLARIQLLPGVYEFVELEADAAIATVQAAFSLGDTRLSVNELAVFRQGDIGEGNPESLAWQWDDEKLTVLHGAPVDESASGVEARIVDLVGRATSSVHEEAAPAQSLNGT